jgi:hypothetical protein
MSLHFISVGFLTSLGRTGPACFLTATQPAADCKGEEMSIGMLVVVAVLGDSPLGLILTIAFKSER